MTLHWSPLPHVLLEAGGSSQAALNALLYAMTLGLLGSCLWLVGLLYVERDR